MARAAHARCRPQVVRQLFFQYSRGLHEEAAVNRFVRHSHARVVGELNFQLSGNLLRKARSYEAIASTPTPQQPPPRHPQPAPIPSRETSQSTKPNYSTKSPRTPAMAKNQTSHPLPPAHQSPAPP